MGRDGFWDDIVPRVDAELCRGCADCAAVVACLAQSIRRQEANSVPVVDESLCFGCYSCASACPHKAVIMPRFR